MSDLLCVLQSVLQQTAQPTTPDDDLLSSLQTHHRMPGQHTISSAHSNSSSNLTNLAGNNGQSPASPNVSPTPNGNSSAAAAAVSPLAAAKSSSMSNINATDGPASAAAVGRPLPLSALPAHMQPLLTTTAVKKQGVSGESSDTTGHQLSRDILIPKYDKDFGSKQLIKEAIMDNDFLKNLDSSQVRELVDSMYGLEVRRGEYVIREGEAGAHLFVSAAGEFEVIQAGTVLGRMGEGKAFGELAILYNCTRTASIKGE